MAALMRQIFKNLQIVSRKTSFTTSNNNWSAISSLARNLSSIPTPYEIVDLQEERRRNEDLVNAVNNQICSHKQGRLFAVVHIAGKQFKITEGDVIIIEGYWPPDAGDKISLDKVLLVGAADFTLIGRPLVQRELVKVEATVIEKTLSHTKTHFRKKRRKQYTRIHFFRIPQTLLRINRVEIVGEVNHPPEVTEVKSRTF